MCSCNTSIKVYLRQDGFHYLLFYGGKITDSSKYSAPGKATPAEAFVWAANQICKE